MKVNDEKEETVEAAEGQGSASRRGQHIHGLPGQVTRLLRRFELWIGQEEQTDTAAKTEEVAVRKPCRTGGRHLEAHLPLFSKYYALV